MAGKYWRDLFMAIDDDSEDITIIVPDYKVCALNTIIEVILTGEARLYDTRLNKYESDKW